MAAMPSVGAAVCSAAQMWEDDSDEEDQVDQQKPKQRRIKPSVTSQVMPRASPPVETMDCWDDADEDTLVESVQVKPAPVPVPEKKLDVADELVETDTAPSLAAGEEVAPKVMPAIQQRHWGIVQWFRGSRGWVTSDDVETDRTVNPLGYSDSFIHGAIYLHKSDCQTKPRYEMEVSFRVEPDRVGFLKCVDVREESWTQYQKSMQRTSNSKPRETVSGDSTQKGHKDSKDKPSSNAPKDDAQDWMSKRLEFQAVHPWTSKPVKPVHSNSPSTAPGSSRASSRASSLASARADRPRHMHSSLAASIARVSKHVEIQQPTVSIHVQIEEPAEETPSEKPPVAESWEDEASEEAQDEVDTKVTTGYMRRSEQKVDVEIEEPTEEPPCADSWDQPPVAAPAAVRWEGDEVPKCWSLKRPRQKLANQKLAKPKMAPQEGQLAQFCEAMGPEFSFEFVARHLGTDFDAIVQSAVDVHSLDSLVRGGMKPLHRNKFFKALRQEMAQRVSGRESPKPELADQKLATPKMAPQEGQLAQFCEAMGPEFPFEFVARHLGTDFDAIVQNAVDVHSLDSLVQGGMKPLHRNKFCKALRQEMAQRVTRRESPKPELADFLAELGPEFNSTFLAHNLGTNDLDEIITRFTDLDDLDVLVVAGMKPLLRNKLHRQLALERKRRAAEC